MTLYSNEQHNHTIYIYIYAPIEQKNTRTYATSIMTHINEIRSNIYRLNSMLSMTESMWQPASHKNLLEMKISTMMENFHKLMMLTFVYSLRVKITFVRNLYSFTRAVFEKSMNVKANLSLRLSTRCQSIELTE